MPARFRDIIRVCGEYGIDLDEKGGKHNFKLSRPGTRKYPIPAHNGPKSEITDVYIRAMCRHFELDLEEFTGKL